MFGTAALLLTVPEASQGLRLDHFLTHLQEGVSRSHIVGAIKRGHVLVNGAAVKAGYKLKAGDAVSGSLAIRPAVDSPPVPQDIEFAVLYEDEAVLVVDKPPNLVVHPGSGNREGTLINGLLHRYHDLAGVGDQDRPGVVHRLDKDTSGLLVVARTRDALRALVRDFKQRRVNKVYVALVHGAPDRDEGLVAEPIGRHPIHRQKMAIRPVDGRPAVSRWRVLQRYGAYSLCEITIETGRTHQIRVHLASIGHPVAGDRLYGSGRNNEPFPRQMLHAWKLAFAHPVSGESMSFVAPLPADFDRVLKALQVDRC